MSDVSGIAGSSGVNFNSLLKNADCNVELAFAMLQMELAQTNKSAAQDKIDAIRESQQTSKSYTTTINAMRVLAKYDTTQYGALPTDADTLSSEIETCKAALDDLQSKLKGHEDKAASRDTSFVLKTEKASTDYWFDNQYLKNAPAYAPLRVGGKEDHNMYEMQQGIEALTQRLSALEAMQTVQTNKTPSGQSVIAECNINVTGNFNQSQVSDWMASIEALQDELGSDIQQQMVLIQDHMGQYNSYTQGATSAISNYSETLKAVARG